MSSREINIYPADWYYNMCVHGYLEVLELGLGEDELKRFFEEDGSVKIPGDVAKAIYGDDKVPMPSGVQCRCEPPNSGIKRVIWWWAKKSLEVFNQELQSKSHEFRKIISPIWGKLFHFKAGAYPNLLQRKWNEKAFLDSIFAEIKTKGNVNCSMCGSLFDIEGDTPFYQVFFSQPFSSHLGSSLKEVPNFYWDNTPSLPMCPHCRSYLLCFHIVKPKGIFIDLGSFKVNWEINRLLEQISAQNNRYRRLSCMTLLGSKIRKAAVGWMLSGINVIAINQNRIRHDTISPRVAQWLIDYRVSRLLRRFEQKEHETIWEHLLGEDTTYFLHLAYRALKVKLGGKPFYKNDEEEKSLQKSMDVLSLLNLYSVIQNIERGGKNMRVKSISHEDLCKAGAESPFDVNQNSSKNLIFRLLELTRLGRRDEVFHLLLRAYISEGRQFPERLSHLLAQEEEFKAGIFSYIAGILSKLENKMEGDQV